MKNLEIEYIEIADLQTIFNQKSDNSNLSIFHFDGNRGLKFKKGKFLRSKHYSILIMKRGVLKVRINLFDYIIYPNDLLIIPPKTIRQFEINESCEYYTLVFTSDYLFESGFFQKYYKLLPFYQNETGNQLQLSPEEFHTTCSFMDLLKNQTEDRSGNSKIVDLLFQAFILKTLDLFQDVKTKETSIYKSELTHRFLSMLPQYFKQSKEVKFYANKLFVSSKYLTQTLTKKTGKSTREHIVDMVLMEAKILLDNPKNTIKDISDKLGFSDQFHFSHFFKKYENKTPTEFRKSNVY